jgi:hypothetical protein
MNDKIRRLRAQRFLCVDILEGGALASFLAAPVLAILHSVTDEAVFVWLMALAVAQGWFALWGAQELRKD